MRLDGKLCGLVEGWANGCDWAELVASTSLDQGDLCRILRRAMEMLRQIPVLVRVWKSDSACFCFDFCNFLLFCSFVVVVVVDVFFFCRFCFFLPRSYA